ncbi:hypothetical protein KC367_g158 [Hortaea werneckii]|nr:hypothetical protein KC367_g158 [Hortaea werneckii]
MKAHASLLRSIDVAHLPERHTWNDADGRSPLTKICAPRRTKAMRVRLLRVQTAYSEGTGLSIPSCGVLGDGAYALLSHQGHVLSCHSYIDQPSAAPMSPGRGFGYGDHPSRNFRQSQTQRRTFKREDGIDNSMDNLTPPPSQEMASSSPAFGPPLAIELDAQQQEAYDDAVAGRNLFITGAAGSGKSTIIRMLISALQDRDKRVRICAPTGKAAEQIGGKTYHSLLRLSQKTKNSSIRQLEGRARTSWLRPRLRDTDVLFIDENSMVSNEDLQRIDGMLRAGRSSNEPFGGVQVIFCGDFLQLSPVKPFDYCLQCGTKRGSVNYHQAYRCSSHGTVQAVDKWAFRAPVWEEADMKHIFLFQVHRQTNDEFKRILFRLWLGKQLTSGEIRLLNDHEYTGIGPVKLYSTRNEVHCTG